MNRHNEIQKKVNQWKCWSSIYIYLLPSTMNVQNYDNSMKGRRGLANKRGQVIGIPPYLAWGKYSRTQSLQRTFVVLVATKRINKILKINTNIKIIFVTANVV